MQYNKYLAQYKADWETAAKDAPIIEHPKVIDAHEQVSLKMPKQDVMVTKQNTTSKTDDNKDECTIQKGDGHNGKQLPIAATKVRYAIEFCPKEAQVRAAKLVHDKRSKDDGRGR